MGKRGEFRSVLPAQAILARIVIGVTGHRKLDILPAIAEVVQSTIDSFREIVLPLSNAPYLG